MNANMKYFLLIAFLGILIMIPSINATMYYTSNDSLYRSFDGNTFTQVTVPIISHITDMCINEDGSKIILLDTNWSSQDILHNVDRILYSLNFGDDWYTSLHNNYTIFNDSRIDGISCNKDMSIILLTQYSGNELYYSTDFGNRFFLKTIATSTLGEASVSNNGQRIILDEKVGGGSLFISTNGGLNYTKTNALSSGNYNMVCADDNTFYAIAQSSKERYISYNGTSWINKGVGTDITSYTDNPICNEIIYNSYGTFSNNNLTTITALTNKSWINAINNFSQYYAINTTSRTNIITSTNGINYTLYKNGLTNLSILKVSDQTIIPPTLNASCIDSNIYCSQTDIHYGVDFNGSIYIESTSCELNNSIYCTNGCGYDSLNNAVCLGNINCSSQTTNDYCGVIGRSTCDGTTKYKVCELINGCPRYSISSYSCPTGNYCTMNNPIEASCSILNFTSGLTNNPAFTVTPNTAYYFDTYTSLIGGEITTKNNTIFSVNNELKRVDISSKEQSVVEGFAINTLPYTSFISHTCDYKETIISTTQIIYEVNASTIIFPTSTNSMIINFNASIKSSIGNVSNLNFTIEDSFGNYLIPLNIQRDESLKRLCVYDYLTLTTLFCDTSINSYDDLNNVNIIVTIDFDSHTYTITSDLYRWSKLRYNSVPSVFTGNELSQIVFETDSNSNVTITNLIVKTIPNFEGFRNVTYNDYNLYTCTYGVTGCKVMRTYLNLNAYPDFTNYRDWNVCVNGLSLSQSDINAIANGEQPSMTLEEKHFIYALIIIIVVSLLITVLIGIVSRGSEKVGGIALIAFLFTFLLGLVFFGFIGWISTIFAILIGILDAIFIVIGFKILFFSTSGG